MTEANYGGKQPNNTAYIKQFTYGSPIVLWKTIPYTKLDSSVVSVITTAPGAPKDVYIQGDLFVDGSIITPSDARLKQNICPIDKPAADKLMNVRPTAFSFKADPSNQLHYGFIAQDFEKEFPELIQYKPDTHYAMLKAVNYMEIIPLLVAKMQRMQQEIDELKKH